MNPNKCRGYFDGSQRFERIAKYIFPYPYFFFAYSFNFGDYLSFYNAIEFFCKPFIPWF